MKERRHLYLYTVIVKPYPVEGSIPEVMVEAYNIEQAAYKLGKPLDAVVYIDKKILA